MNIKKIYRNIKHRYHNTFITPNCSHLISLNKMCGMRSSSLGTIVLVGCDKCGQVIQVKGDEQYISKMQSIMNSY